MYIKWLKDDMKKLPPYVFTIVYISRIKRKRVLEAWNLSSLVVDKRKIRLVIFLSLFLNSPL